MHILLLNAALPPPPPQPSNPPLSAPCPALPHAHLQRRTVGHLQVTGDVLNRAWFVQQCIAVVKELRLAGLRLSLPDLIGRPVPPFPADPRHCHRVLIVDKQGTVVHFVDFTGVTAYQSKQTAVKQVRLGGLLYGGGLILAATIFSVSTLLYGTYTQRQGRRKRNSEQREATARGARACCACTGRHRTHLDASPRPWMVHCHLTHSLPVPTTRSL